MDAPRLQLLPTPTSYEDAVSLHENLKLAYEAAQAAADALDPGEAKTTAEATVFEVESDMLLLRAFVDAFGAPDAIRAAAPQNAEKARNEILFLERRLGDGSTVDQELKAELLGQQNDYVRMATAWDAVAAAEPSKVVVEKAPTRAAKKNANSPVPATKGAGAAEPAAPAKVAPAFSQGAAASNNPQPLAGAGGNEFLVVRAMRPSRWRAGRQFTPDEVRIPVTDLSEGDLALIQGDPVLAVSIEVS